MSPRRRNPKLLGHGKPWRVLMVALVALAAGVAICLVIYCPTARRQAERPSERPAGMEIHRPTRAIKVFLPKDVGTSTFLTPVEVKVPATADLPRAALEQLIAASEEGGTSRNLIPMGTKVLSVRIGKGIAEVNFSKEFISNFNGGSHQEALTLNAILHTMAQFPGAQKTRILVEGKPTDTLGGHFEISQPMSPDSAWLESSGSR